MRRYALSFLFLLMTAGMSMAQLNFPTVSGHVTLNGEPVEGFTLLITAEQGLEGQHWWVETNAEGYYESNVVPTTITIASYDTFSYQPFSETFTAEVGQDYTVDVALEARPQDAAFSGNVSFDGQPYVSTVYMLKLPDTTDMSDFKEVESHFMLPGPIPTRWASYSIETDAQGNFDGDVLFGKYVVYVAGEKDILPHWSAVEVTGDVRDYNIVMREKVHITGTVSNMEGFDWVTVSAFSVNAGRPFQTDTMGIDSWNYDLAVAPGEYKVRVQGFFTVGDESYMYMAFYDSARTPQEADIVDANMDVQGIDFNLPDPAVYPFTVNGVVTSNQSGKPIAGAEVNVISHNPLQNTLRSYSAVTDDKGAYTIEGQTMQEEDSLIAFVNAENFFAEFYENETTFLTADRVAYGPNETITLDFGLDTLDASSGFSISGSVMDEEGSPIGFGQVTAYTTATNVGVTYTQVDSNGNYAFDTIFPDNSTVLLQAWAGFEYLPEIYKDAQSWQDATPIEIDGANVDGIDFTLQAKPSRRLAIGQIRGHVTAPNGKSGDVFDGAMVYVREQGQSNWEDVDYVDSKGRFSLGIETYGTYELLITSPDNQDHVTTVSVTEETGLTTDVTISLTSIGDEKPAQLARSNELHNAYPNPFNPSTTIEVDMARTEDVTLTIYNVAGQIVKTIHKGMLPAGSSNFVWNGTNNNGKVVASGLYFYQLRSASGVQTKTLIFLK